MRITGGKAAGVLLQVPRKGPEVRPATDRMREAVFSSIGSAIEGARVLDLFAGTGAYGIEALSRGAAEVTWIEADRRIARVLEDNRKALEKSLGHRCTANLLTRDIRRHGLSSTARFDLIFADPPYDQAKSLLDEIFLIAGQHLAEAPGAKFLLEVPGDLSVGDIGWDEVRRFGKGSSRPSLRVLARSKS